MTHLLLGQTERIYSRALCTPSSLARSQAHGLVAHDHRRRRRPARPAPRGSARVSAMSMATSLQRLRDRHAFSSGVRFSALPILRRLMLSVAWTACGRIPSENRCTAPRALPEPRRGATATGQSADSPPRAGEAPSRPEGPPRSLLRQSLRATPSRPGRRARPPTRRRGVAVGTSRCATCSKRAPIASSRCRPGRSRGTH
jgi:hypothetical protein